MTTVDGLTGHAALPNSFSRRVLLTVSGLSPQVITETVYALAITPDPDERFVPTEIHALTTTLGKQRISAALFSPGLSKFPSLCSEYGLPADAFGPAMVHVVCDAKGQPLSDIRTPEDNAAMADAVTELVRRFTGDASCALHVSLAGGRKTMGYYAGYALSLFGRPQDRLSHVLVNPPFESHPDFYFPPRASQRLHLPDGQQIETADAKISLAHIPFVRLRNGLPQALLDGQTSFAQAVAAAAAASASAPALVLDLPARSVVADGVAIRLPPMQLALLAVLVQRARTGQPALRAPLKDTHDAEWADEVLRDLRVVYGLMHLPDRVEASLRQESSGMRVSPSLSRLRTVLRQHLAPGRDRLYFDDGQSHRHKRYRVPLPPSALQVIAPAGTSLESASLPKPAR